MQEVSSSLDHSVDPRLVGQLSIKAALGRDSEIVLADPVPEQSRTIPEMPRLQTEREALQFVSRDDIDKLLNNLVDGEVGHRRQHGEHVSNLVRDDLKEKAIEWATDCAMKHDPNKGVLRNYISSTIKFNFIKTHDPNRTRLDVLDHRVLLRPKRSEDGPELHAQDTLAIERKDKRDSKATKGARNKPEDALIEAIDAARGRVPEPQPPKLPNTLLEAIDELPVGDRVAARMFFINGSSIEQIAASTRRQVSSLAKRISFARKRLEPWLPLDEETLREQEEYRQELLRRGPKCRVCGHHHRNPCVPENLIRTLPANSGGLMRTFYAPVPASTRNGGKSRLQQSAISQ